MTKTLEELKRTEEEVLSFISQLCESFGDEAFPVILSGLVTKACERKVVHKLFGTMSFIVANPSKFVNGLSKQDSDYHECHDACVKAVGDLNQEHGVAMVPVLVQAIIERYQNTEYEDLVTHAFKTLVTDVLPETTLN